MTQTSGPRPPMPPAPAPAAQRKRINSTDLMQNARSIIVLHHGEEYLLRITKAGKLILTK